jgi:hypothetical protein
VRRKCTFTADSGRAPTACRFATTRYTKRSPMSTSCQSANAIVRRAPTSHH